jgi:hypothetical protein
VDIRLPSIARDATPPRDPTTSCDSSRASGADDNKYTADPCSSSAARAARPAPRRSLPGPLFRADAGYVAIAAPADALPTIETLVVEAVESAAARIRRSRRREGALLSACAGTRRRSRPAGARAAPAPGGGASGRVDADALYEVKAVSTELHRPYMTPRQRRARAASLERNRSGWTRTALKRSREQSTASSASLLLKGDGHSHRRAGVRAVWGGRRQRAVARHGWDRRRADGNHRGVSREAHGRTRGRRGGGSRAPPRGRARSATWASSPAGRDRRSARMHRSETDDRCRRGAPERAHVAARAGRRRVVGVVKADGYGHGAVDVSRASLDAGADALCVGSHPEALELRREFPSKPDPLQGPVPAERGRQAAKDANVEVCSRRRRPSGGPARPSQARNTGMGRYGLAELRAPTRDVVG